MKDRYRGQRFYSWSGRRVDRVFETLDKWSLRPEKNISGSLKREFFLFLSSEEHFRALNHTEKDGSGDSQDSDGLVLAKEVS